VITDIDCAHRVGPVKDEKQTMLVRFYARDLTNLSVSKKSSLKGSDFILYEDATVKNRRLLNALKLMKKFESVWILNGCVWIKKTGCEKQRVGIHDNLTLL
jgi:hypothetical protein